MDGKLYITIFLVICLAWDAHAQVNCTSTGAGRFADPNDATCKNYTLCVLVSTTTGQYLSYNYVCPTTSLFNPATSQCTANYVCNANTTTANTTTSTVCTAEGFTQDPTSTNCSSYIQCLSENGTFVEFPITCPDGSFYNPNSTLCETDYVCGFTCTAAGRFPDPAVTTCRNYYLCVLATNGTYAQYLYTCPSTSVFNPNTRVCTTSYTCPT
ncbi:probable endochitinase [Vanessa cardui]|uniref:probable endochitinase n=1 Tax=Vanessa cardui TaxID=171605 RepID=UPI001F142CE6|nr:probable endochitinase [Vanessa cardui]